MKIIKETYDSLLDFREALNRPKLGTMSATNITEKFTGTASYEEADRLMVEGDDKTAELIRFRDSREKDRSCELFNSPAGFMPNIGAYMTGRPDNMINIRERGYKNTKVISVTYIPIVPYFVDKEQLAAAGQKVLNIIASLEAHGYRCNLYVSCLSQPRKKNKKDIDENTILALFVKIKDAGKHLNPLKVAYPIANPSFFRRHCFAWIDTVYPAQNAACVIDDYLRRDKVPGHVLTYDMVTSATGEDIIKTIIK